MGIALAVSGILALLGGGAGALAYYRKYYGADANGPAGPPPTVNPIQNPMVNADGEVNLAGGGTAVVTPAGTLTDINAGIVSPLPANISRSTVVSTDTNTPSSNPITSIASKVSSIFGTGLVDTVTTPAVPVPDPSYTGGAINPATQKIVAAPGAPPGAPLGVGTPAGIVPTNYGIVVKI